MSHVFCEGQEVYFIIALKDADQPVGYVRINRMHPTASLRFAMGAERGKGFCKNALRSFRLQAKRSIDYTYSLMIPRTLPTILKGPVISS